MSGRRVSNTQSKAPETNVSGANAVSNATSYGQTKRYGQNQTGPTMTQPRVCQP
jgi:hypothetical protein